MASTEKISRRDGFAAPKRSRSPQSDKHKLLLWYDQVRRQLPWRETKDPYKIWISEVMLQQTQVQTVIPYYRRFLERFPTVETLATGSIDEVLALWSGLGYYRRARQLHAAAREVQSKGGRVPKSAAELLELPGIGPYTAAAIASIAFDEAVPVLDGNVERLLARRLAWEGNPKKAAGKRLLLSAADSLLDANRPGDSNQALMEMGATVCRPNAPLCSDCPLVEGCEAFTEGQPERYPTAQKRRASLKVEWAVVIVREDRRVLMFRRPKDSPLMADLWELPNVPISKDTSTLERDLESQYGGSWKLHSLGIRVGHQVTFRSLKLHLYSATVEGGDQVQEGPEATWIDPADPSEFAMSSMVGKVLARLPRED